MTRTVGAARLLLALLFPLLVLAGAGVMTALDLNGTSIALNGVNWREDDSVLLGKPRAIRSDEFALSTPNEIGNDRRGLPQQPWIGLTPTYVPGTSVGVPAAHWTEVFKPHDYGFFLLSDSKAIAWRWWTLLAAGLVGCYTLLRLLTRHTGISAGLTLLAVCTPYSAWWSLMPAQVLGYVALATACLVAAMRAARLRWTLLLGLLAGFWGGCTLFVLYPPWQVSLAWVALAVLVGSMLDDRPGWRRVVAAFGTALAVVVPVGAIWLVQAQDAIRTTAETYYPGNRLSEAGGGNLPWFLDAPSSVWTSLRSTDLPDAGWARNGERLATNNTAITSTWIPLPLLVVSGLLLLWAVFAVRKRRAAAAPDEAEPAAEVPVPVWTWFTTTAVTVLLLAWALVPQVPSVVGTLTLLNRVPGSRAPLAIGFGAALMLGLGATVLRRVRPPLWFGLLVLLGAAGTVFAHVWAVSAMNWNPPVPQPEHVAAIAAAVAVPVALLVFGRWAGVAALAAGAAALAVFVPVNPLMRGLGPLAEDPVVRALRPYATGGDPARVVVFSRAPLALHPVVTSSGVENLSGMTIYPDADVWNTLAPDRERDWNNYAKYTWTPAAAGAEPDIQGIKGTSQRLVVDPCDPDVVALGLDLALSTGPVEAACLTQVQTIRRGENDLYLYAYPGARRPSS